MNNAKVTTAKAVTKPVITLDTARVVQAIQAYFLGDEIHYTEKTKDKPATARLALEEGEFSVDIETRKTIIALDEAPKPVLRALAASRLSRAEKSTIAKHLPVQDFLDEVVVNPQSFYRAMKAMEGINNKNFYEVEINNRWYPVPMTIGIYHNMWTGGYTCNISGTGKIQDESQNWRFYVSSKNFMGDDGRERPQKVRDILKDLGMRPTTPEAIKDLAVRVAKAEKLSSQHGKVVDVTSPVISKTTFFFFQTLQVQNLGTKDKPRTLIIEDDLEAAQERDYYDEDQKYDLPFIRAFSPDMKRYVYVDVADVVEHAFDHTGRDRLVLPDEIRQVLDAVFDTHTTDVFGDMFRGRHGGMVILANGPSGVGKTLTAEVFSEYTDRPLYVLEMGELGTSLESVEQNLQKIFTRAARWNAILLFDEADIFLSKRNEDLDRSAIVGVFLRLLDMYEGTFFLTTNRAEVMDPAFKSRITLKLDYPDLSNESRGKVWRNLLKAAGFSVKDATIDSISGEPLNGRQVRNLVRLLKILHPNSSTLTAEQIRNIFRFAAK